MKQVEGVVTGIVKEIDAEHACLNSIPWMDASYRSNWAPIAAPMSGNNRGMFMMPEKDDEVLVAFDHNSIDHPYVIGFLWNGVDKSPEDGTGPSVRRLRTVSGHIVEFDDRDGKERILIKTKGKHEIELKDSAPASITIKSNGGQEIDMVDAPTASINVKTTAGQKLTLNDVPASVTIETVGQQKMSITDTPPGFTTSVAGGSISISATAAGVTITSPSILTVNAPFAQFTGILQASTIIAGAYTPAPGDTFGL